MAAVCIGQMGCNSIYHRAWTMLPAEPESQLKMRVEEAHRTVRLATEAGTKLLADLKSGVESDLIQADFDRVEMFALELQRRVLATRDIPGASGLDSRLGDEIERLQMCSETWLTFVATARREGVAAQLRRLEEVLAVVQAAPTN